MSLTDRVAADLRSRIIRGELAPGARLPSERVLSEQLGVSRVTVVRALTRLRADGLLVTRHGSGTFVDTGDRLLDMIVPASVRPVRGPGPRDDVLDLRQATTAGPLDLLAVATDAVREGLVPALREDGTAAEDVAVLLAERLTAEGRPTWSDQLLLTTGATAALGLVVDALLAPGRPVIVETPTYPDALRVIAHRRHRTLGWPAGPTGWSPDLLQWLFRGRPPGLLYLQPDGHNPTGATMPPDVREAVVRAAVDTGWTIVVDETLRPLRLAEAPSPPSLSGFDDRVITVSSLSKAVWGGLRLGWIRAPAAVVRRLRSRSIASHPGALDQVFAAELLSSPAVLDRIIGRRRALLTANLRHLTERLDGLGLHWQKPTSGVTLWLGLGGRSSRAVVGSCARRGLLLEPAGTYAVDGQDDDHLRIPLTPPPDVLDQAVATLSGAIQAIDPTSPRQVGPAMPRQGDVGGR
jgi:DNA-binding transcriptional MocR family regulator